jgi:hypothetical protein
MALAATAWACLMAAPDFFDLGGYGRVVGSCHRAVGGLQLAPAPIGGIEDAALGHQKPEFIRCRLPRFMGSGPDCVIN